MKIFRKSEMIFHLIMIIAAAFIAVQSFAQEATFAFPAEGENDHRFIDLQTMQFVEPSPQGSDAVQFFFQASDTVPEVWPGNDDPADWITLNGASIFHPVIVVDSIFIPQGPGKQTFLVSYHYYRGFSFRQSGVIKVQTDAFTYSLPGDQVDDRFMNDVLVALMQQVGIRVDIRRRGEWLQIGPWIRPIPAGMIFDTRQIPQTPRE